MQYQGVLFDFDYTLGDATEAIFAGYTHGLTTMGYPAPELEAVRNTVGMLVEDGFTWLTGNDDPADRKRFYGLFHPMARDLQAQGQVKLLPGARELLEGLKAAGVPAAIVTSKNIHTIDQVAGATGIKDLLACIIGGGMTETEKPHPAGTLLALERMGVEPAGALYCGDTVIDAQTAKNAGCDFCAVLNGTTPGAAFAPWPHVRIAPDLWDLKAWLGV